MKVNNFILFGLLIAREYFLADACHQANFDEIQPVYMNERFKRNVGNPFSQLQNNRNLENFFTNCMSQKSLSYSWRSIVHFIITDTKWYQELDQLYCSSDDSSSCWNYNVDFLIDRSSYTISKSVKECIALYEQRSRSKVIVKSRARRQLNFNNYLLSILANNSTLAPIFQPTNQSSLNAQSLMNWYTYNQYVQPQQAQPQPHPYQGQPFPQGQPVYQGSPVVPYQTQQVIYAAQRPNGYQAQPSVGPVATQNINYPAQQPNNQAWNNQPAASLYSGAAATAGQQQQILQQTSSPTSPTNPVTYKMEEYIKLKSDNNIYQLLGLPTVPLPSIDERDMKTYTNWQQNNDFLKQLGMPTLPSPTFTLTPQIPSSLAPVGGSGAFPNSQIHNTDWKPYYPQYVQGNNGLPVLSSQPYLPYQPPPAGPSQAPPAGPYQPPPAGPYPPYQPQPAGTLASAPALPSSQNYNNGFGPVTATFCPQVSQFSQCIENSMGGNNNQARSSNRFDVNAVLSFVSAHYSRCTNAFGIHKSRMDRMPCAESISRSITASRPSDCSTQILNDIVRPDGPMRPAIEMCNRATRAASRVKERPKQYNFSCSKTWTKFYNTHNPSNTTGDYEGLWEVQMKHFSEVCTNPTVVEVQLADGRPYHIGGDTVTFNPNMGITCVNAMQLNGVCNDYKVRFCC